MLLSMHMCMCVCMSLCVYIQATNEHTFFQLCCVRASCCVCKWTHVCVCTYYRRGSEQMDKCMQMDTCVCVCVCVCEMHVLQINIPSSSCAVCVHVAEQRRLHPAPHPLLVHAPAPCRLSSPLPPLHKGRTCACE